MLPGVVLAPTDLSEASLPAAAYAAGLVRRMGGTLVLLHVVPHREIEEGVAEGRYVDRQLEEIHGRLLWWFTAFVPPSARQGVAVKTAVRIGHAEQEILEAARAVHAEMIVMATHGRSGFRRAVLGSVAEAVLRHAPCPVLTIPPTALRGRAAPEMRGADTNRVPAVAGQRPPL